MTGKGNTDMKVCGAWKRRLIMALLAGLLAGVPGAVVLTVRAENAPAEQDAATPEEPGKSSDETYLASGTCGAEGDGSNLRWTLDNEGRLTITGTGRMANYNNYDDVPWNKQYGNKLTAMVLEEGVTSIGKNAACKSNMRLA